MTQFKSLLILLAFCGLTIPAAALDVYRVGSPGPFSVENVVLYSARTRGSFEKAGIDLKHVVVSNISLATQRLSSGDFEAHTYTTPAWHANNNGTFCTTMIMPLVWKFSGAIIASVPTWKDLKGGTLVLSSLTSLSSQTVVDALEANGVPRGEYEVKSAGTGETEVRAKAMLSFAEKGPAATLAYDPLLSILRYAKGMTVLSDVGAIPVVSAGLMVRCDDKKDPKKWELHRRVVSVLMNEIEWIMDEKASDATLIPWIRETIEKSGYLEKYGKSYEGRPVSLLVDPAKGIAERTRNLLGRAWPPKEDMERSVRQMLKKVPDDLVPNYFDPSLMPKRP